MSRFEVRVCDYCGHASRPMTFAQFEHAGWSLPLRHDGGTWDRCPVCSFCEDLEPVTAGTEQVQPRNERSAP